MAAATVRASTSGVTRSAGATRTFTFPGTPQVGDTIAIIASSDANPTITGVPSGWTHAYTANVVNGSRHFLWKVYASGDGTSVNVTWSADPNLAWAVVVFDGSVHGGIGTFGTVTTRGASSTTATAVATGSSSLPNLVVFHEKAATHTGGPTISPTTTTIQSVWDTTASGASVYVGTYDTSGGTAGRTATYTASSGNGAGVQVPLTAGAAINYTPSQDEPLDATDTPATVVGAVRAPADPAAGSDASPVDRGKSSADSAGATDSALAEPGKNAADPAAGSDAASFVVGLVRSPADPGAATDTVSLVQAQSQTLPDTAGATDSCSVSLTQPTTVTNNAEGGAAAGGNGTPATNLNTGGASGTALLVVANLNFSTSAPPYGSYCYHGAGAGTTLEYGQLRLTSAQSSYSIHVNFRYNGTPSTEGIWFNPMDDANATLARVHITAANQLKVVNALGNTTWTSGTSLIPYTMVPGTDYTLQITSTVNNTTGTFNVRLKPKASATVLGSATMVGNTGATSFQRFVFGKFTTAVAVAGGHDFDEITVVGGSTSFIEDPTATVNISATDTAGATDAALRAMDVPKSAADSAAASDSAADVIDQVRPFNESLAASDVAALAREFTVDDAASAVDTQAPQELAWSDVYDDAASILDSTTQAAVVSAADSAAATDLGDDVLDSVRAAADSAGATDSSSRILDSVRSAADNATASDTTALVTDFTRSAAETASGVDVASRTLDALRDLADNAGLTDAAVSVEDFPRTPDEIADATDTASAVAGITRTGSDSAAAFDSIDVSVQSSTGQTLNDNGLGSDVVDWTMDRIRTVDDFLSAVDAAQRAADVTLNAADQASGADATSYAWGYVRAAADQASASDDAATGDRNYVSAKDEPVGGTDRVGIEYGPNPADSATASDAVARDNGLGVDDVGAGEDGVDVDQDQDQDLADLASAVDAILVELIPLYADIETRAISATLRDSSRYVASMRS